MSACDLILTGSDFSTQDVSFGKPRANKAGGKSVQIMSVHSGQALNLTTPLMLTWGANENVDDASGRRWYDMSLQFPNPDFATDSATAFLENLKALEAHIKNLACTSCAKDWFNKQKQSPEVVDALFTPILRYPKDPVSGEPDTTRAPTLRVKLDFWDNAFNAELYDVNDRLLFPSEDPQVTPLTLIGKGSHVATVLKCGGVWLANGKFGVTWRLVQAVVQPRVTLQGRCHITLSDADRRTLSASASSPPEDTANVSDTDEDEDGDDVTQAVADAVAEATDAAPPTTVKRKVVRRAAKK